jgi:hypothetical protein
MIWLVKGAWATVSMRMEPPLVHDFAAGNESAAKSTLGDVCKPEEIANIFREVKAHFG